MSKIERYQGNVQAFASSSQGVERTVFGETTQANDLTSQITAAFLRGWGVVGPSEHPSLEDFNGAMYALSQFIAYQHQAGIPEWHDKQEYYVGSVCTHEGVSYQSLRDANFGNEPPSVHWASVITSNNGGKIFQPLDATLTALAALTGAKDKLAYFNAADTAALTTLTAFARSILAQTDAPGVRSTLGLDAMGIGGLGTALSSLDWQTFDFVPGARYFVSVANMTNVPADMVLPSNTALQVIINVSGYETAVTRHVDVWFSTVTVNDYRRYSVRMGGSPGARNFKSRQMWSSDDTIPLANLALNDLGLNYTGMPTVANVDWQKVDLVSGSIQIWNCANWTNAPAGLPTTSLVVAEVTGRSGTRATIDITAFNGGSTRRLYTVAVDAAGTPGSRTFNVLEIMTNGSVASGLFPIGMPFYWPNAKMPNELLPEWSGMTFLKWNDATFSATTFPKLALVIPSLKLSDARGEFIRVWDDGRGVDTGRALLSAQGDAMRQIKGSVTNVQFRTQNSISTDSLVADPTTGTTGNASAGSDPARTVRIDTSLQSGLPIAAENRPRNVAFNFLVRAA